MGSIQSAMIRFLLKKSNMWNKPLTEIRKDMEKMKSKGMPEGIINRKPLLNGVNCEFFSGSGMKKNKVILYFHGGGNCLGISNYNREFVASISKRTGYETFFPDFRLAPENPFPAALEDAQAVYTGLLEQDYKPQDIIIMGDSSGCGLAFSALLELKKRNARMPGQIICITPVFDFTGKGSTFVTRAKKDPFKMEDPLGVAKNYIAKNDPLSPLLSPLYGELKGLPPVLIHAADYDVFLSDSLRMKEKLENAGVRVEIKIYKKMWHIFHMQEAAVPEAKKAMEDIVSYINSNK